MPPVYPQGDAHYPLHRVLDWPEPETTRHGPIPPDTQTFNEASDFGLQIEQPVGLNLAADDNLAQTKDPLADIKKRERDLQNERTAREAELQREYEKRL